MNGLPVDVDSVGNLLAPLDPSKAVNLEQVISYRAIGASPQGSRLVSSLLIATTAMWLGLNNLPITIDRRVRTPPFREFSHQYLPSGIRDAKLTPWKLGIVYCWVIRGSILQGAWPGNITALIYDAEGSSRRKAFLGRLVILDAPAQTSTVDSDPLQGVVGSLNMTTNNTLITSGTLSQPLSDAGMTMIQHNYYRLEKAYLESIAIMFFKSVVHPSYEKVSNTYNVDIDLPYRNHFDSTIVATLHLYQGPLYKDLTWDQVLHMILQLSIEFANRQGPPGPKYAQIQVEGGELLAKVVVGPKTIIGVATS